MKRFAPALALLAAALYALSSPLSKLLLQDVQPTMMAAFLYLGAGLGMALLGLLRREHATDTARLSKGDFPYIAAMIVLDIFAPVLLMIGLAQTSAAHVSLLNNFEIVATTLIALLFFHEKVSCGCGWPLGCSRSPASCCP